MDRLYEDRLPFGFSEDLAGKGIDMRELGIDEVAWSFPEIFDVFNQFVELGYSILGGDVYRLETGKLTVTGDSWFMNKTSTLSSSEFQQATRTKAIEYVTAYHDRNGNDFVYTVVITPAT